MEIKIKSLSEGDLREIKQELGLNDVGERISMNDIENILNKFGAPHLRNEICKDGAASDFCNELNGPK